MKTDDLAGYQEIAHTADWELQVWAPDLPALLEQAARGMYHLQGLALKSGPRREHSFTLTYQDIESLIVEFLGELLYLIETTELAFDRFDLKITDYSLHADLSGAPLELLSKEIKAVTYHNLTVHQTKQGLQANIVFDV
jgi:SHS2 domain-containing protein